MKKFCISLLLIFIIIVTVAVGIKSNTNSAEYLRIHIRANSNLDSDQQVKYLVKKEIVSYLTPYVANCTSKAQATDMLVKKSRELEEKIDCILRQKGFSYSSNVVVRNEQFPTRVYGDFTLEQGFYDAVIVELGKAQGDNWWCVVYPPLCFTGDECGVIYKSRILEIIEKFRQKNSAN